MIDAAMGVAVEAQLDESQASLVALVRRATAVEVRRQEAYEALGDAERSRQYFSRSMPTASAEGPCRSEGS